MIGQRTYNEILKEIEETQDVEIFCTLTKELEGNKRSLTLVQLRYAKEHIDKHSKRLHEPIAESMHNVMSLLGFKRNK